MRYFIKLNAVELFHLELQAEIPANTRPARSRWPFSRVAGGFFVGEHSADLRYAIVRVDFWPGEDVGLGQRSRKCQALSWYYGFNRPGAPNWRGASARAG